jgi:hypothetical protein
MFSLQFNFNSSKPCNYERACVRRAVRVFSLYSAVRVHLHETAHRTAKYTPSYGNTRERRCEKTQRNSFSWHKNNLNCLIRFSTRFKVREQYTFIDNASIFLSTGTHIYKYRIPRPLSVRMLRHHQWLSANCHVIAK